MLKEGYKTSEFKFAGLIGLFTMFGDQFNVFDVSAFSGDPQLMMIFRCVQVLSLAGIAAAYIWGRSMVKEGNGK